MDKKEPLSTAAVAVPNDRRLKLVSTELVARTAEPGPTVYGSQQAGELLCGLIGDCDREHVVALHLNSANKVVAVDLVAVGTLNAADVHPREVFKAAILSNAAAIILGHNHPSGSLDPSQSDYDASDRLAASGAILGIPLLDSLVVSGKRYRQVDYYTRRREVDLERTR